jgi:AraC-like DNA-binding protein
LYQFLEKKQQIDEKRPPFVFYLKIIPYFCKNINLMTKKRREIYTLDDLKQLSAAQPDPKLACSTEIFVSLGYRLDREVVANGAVQRAAQPYFTLVKSGSVIVEVDNKEYHCHRNFLLYVDTEVSLRCYSMTDDYLSDIVMFSPANNCYFNMLASKANHFIFLELSDSDAERLDTYFRLLHRRFTLGKYSDEGVNMLLCALFDDVTSMASANSVVAGKDEEMFENFLNLVSTHAQTERNAAFYADKLCVTVNYLQIIIRQFSHHTVKYWIDKVCIDRACRILAESKASITEISNDFAFSSVGAFARFFKRITGLLPNEYRSQQRRKEKKDKNRLEDR